MYRKYLSRNLKRKLKKNKFDRQQTTLKKIPKLTNISRSPDKALEENQCLSTESNPTAESSQLQNVTDNSSMNNVLVLSNSTAQQENMSYGNVRIPWNLEEGINNLNYCYCEGGDFLSLNMIDIYG